MDPRPLRDLSSATAAGRWFRPGILLVGALRFLFALDGLAAQEPPPPPPPDTITAVTDSAAAPAADTPADTLDPVVVVASFPRPGSPRWSAGIWEWSRDDLLASGALTLTELLERIPGVTPVRWGLFGQPEAVSIPGATAGRVQLVLDGYVLDPLAAGTYDLARLELVHLRRVRVSRRAGGLVVDLETVAPTDQRPYSMVEAVTGTPESKLFRGTFMAPRVLGGPLALGVERLDSDGLRRREPANAFTGWLKWALAAGSTGLQLEFRRNTVERVANDTASEAMRQDWILRARGRPSERLTAEAYFGVSAVEEDLTGEPVEDRGAQAGARATFDAGRGWASAAVRARSHARLPGMEAELAGGVTLPARLHLSGAGTWASWDGRTVAAYGVRSEIGPLLGLRTFAEASGGMRGVPALTGADGIAVFTDREELRLGGEFERGRLRLGAARVIVRADSIPTFGLPGVDRNAGASARLLPGGETRGWEATGRIPLPWDPLSIEGWYTRWSTPSPWIYLPQESWRAALVYHHVPLQSGNLEVLARLEGRQRGAMLVPAAETATAAVPALTSLDFYLQIRILDVRAFLRWENITNRLLDHDFPDRHFPGQRVLYGVKWQFWN